MTSPLPPPRANRALRLALLGGVGFLVIGGLVAVAVLVPGHNSAPSAAKTTTPVVSTGESASTSPPSPSTASTAPTSPSPASSLGGLVVPSGDPQGALKVEIASAFVSFNNVINDMETTKTANFALLTEVAADPLLPALEDGLAKLYGQGDIAQGRATLAQLVIQSIAPDGQSANLTACADMSNVRTVNASSGATIGPPGSPRIIDAATLRIRDGRWKVTGLTHPGVC